MRARAGLSKARSCAVTHATLLAVFALVGCGESLFPSGPAASIGIALSSNTVSVAQGGTGTVTVTLTRLNGFTEAVDVNVDGLPNGVTAPTLRLASGQTSGTLTLIATAPAAVGTSALTVRATGPVVNPATALLSLSIQAPAPGFTLSLAPPAVTLPQGAVGTTTVTVARTGGFAGAVTLAATGLPAGVTASFNQASVTGTTSTLTLTASGTAALGAATVTITGTGTGVSNQSATLTLTVQMGTGAITVQATFCPATGNPMWVAFQDGTGAWVRSTESNGTFSGQISAGRGGIAYVTTNATGAVTTTVRYGTTSELQDFSAVFCLGATGAGKTVPFSLLGAGTNNVTLGLGSSAATAPGGVPTASFQNVPDGTIDLIAARSTASGPGPVVNKLLAQRDLNPPAGSTVSVNFNGPTAVDPVNATLTIGALNGEQAFVNYTYRTPNRTLVAYLTDNVSTAASRTMAGFPAVAGSFHQARLIAAPAIGVSDRIRSVDLVFGTVAAKSLTLGPDMGAVTVSSASVSPVLRPQAVMPAAAPYHQSWNFTTSQSSGAQGRTSTVQMTAGYVGTVPATVTLVVPELTTVSGYLVDWGLRPAVTTTWSAVGQSSTGFGAQGAWAEGASTLFAGRLGTVSPP